MNANLQAILTQLNSSQAVSLPDFISALEQEPNIVLSNIFTGTTVNSDTIDFKNCSEGSDTLQNIALLKPSNTANWKFDFTSYDLTVPDIYLKVDSTDDTGSIVSVIMTANLLYETYTIPVLLSKNSDRIIMNLYIDENTFINYNFAMLESFLGATALQAAYPDEFQTATGLDCQSICWTYIISTENMNSISITSSAPDWEMGDLLKFELTNCSITSNIILPYNDDYVSFRIKGDLELNGENVSEVEFVLPSFNNTNSHVIMTDGSMPVTSFGSILSLFHNVDITSLLPANLGLLSDLILKNFIFIYDEQNSDVISYSVDLSQAGNNVEWELIPGVVSIKQPELSFTFSPLYCNVTGILSLGNCDLDFTTGFGIDTDNPETSLYFRLKEIQQSVPASLTDLSPLGVSVSDVIPSINAFDFNLHNLELYVGIEDAIELNDLSVAFSTENSWSMLPGITIDKTYFNLDFTRDDIFKFEKGFISSNIQAGDYTVPIEIMLPESGDWSLSFKEGNDSTDDTDYQEGYSAIPIPGISDIISLIGFDFTDDLPSDLLLEGLELTGFNITFPKPTAGIIHTASFKTRLTSDWSFTSLLTLTDLELQCNMDFTGTTPVVDFDIYGKVTIAGVDVSAYVKKRQGTWTFGIEDTTLNFSLNDLVGIIPFASGVSFPDFINDITDVSIKINKLEMIYNSDLSELLEFSHSIALDKPWVIAQNILECKELLVENRIWNLNTATSLSEGRILCKVEAGNIDIPVQIPLPFNSKEWTMSIYESVEIPSLAELVSVSGFDGTDWLEEILGAVIPELSVSQFDIKFTMEPFSISNLVFKVSFTDGTSITLPPGIKFSCDNVEMVMSAQSGSLGMDYFALNCSIAKDDTVVPVSIKRLADKWEIMATFDDDAVIPIHLDMLESVIPGLSLPSGIGDSGLDIRGICLQLTHSLAFIQFYTVMDIKGFGSIVSFGLLKGSIPVKIMYEANGGDARYGFQILDWPFNMGFMKELADPYLGWILLDFDEFGSILMELPKFYITDGSIDINGEVKFIHNGEVFNLKEGGTENGKGFNIPVKFLFSKMGLSILDGILPNSIPLAPEASLGDLIEQAGGNPENLPYDFQDYLDISIPDGIQYDILISSSGMSIRLSLPDLLSGEKQPIKVLIPALPFVFGTKIYNIGFSSIFGFPFVNVDIESDQFLFPVLVALSYFDPEDLDALVDMRKVNFHVNAKDVWILVSTPIPIPIFYDDVSFKYVGVEGLTLEFGIKLPRPGINLADFNKIADFVKQLAKFITDDDYYLIPQDLGSADLIFTMMPTYAELPKYLGSAVIGTKDNVFTNSATETLCRILNILKKPKITRFVKMIPEELRYIDTDIDLGPLHAVLKTGFTTVEEFKEGMVNDYPSDMLQKLFADVNEGLLSLIYGRWAIASLIDFEVMLGVSLRDFNGGALQVGLHGEIGNNFIGCDITGVTVLNLDDRSNPFIFDLSSKLTLIGQDIATLMTRIDSTGFMMSGSSTLFDTSHFKATAELTGSLSSSGDFLIEGAAEVMLAGIELVDSTAKIDNNSIILNNTWLGHDLDFLFEVSNGNVLINGNASLPEIAIDVQIPSFTVNTPLGNYTVGSLHVSCGVSAGAGFIISQSALDASVHASFTFIKSYEFNFALSSLPNTFDELKNLIMDEVVDKIIDGLFIPDGWEDILALLQNGWAVVENVAGMLVDAYGQTIEFAAEKMSEVLNYSYNQIADALKIMGSIDEEIAQLMRNVFDLPDVSVASVLNGIGTATEVAGEILTSTFFAVQNIGNILESAGFPSEEIDAALEHLSCPVNSFVCVKY